MLAVLCNIFALLILHNIEARDVIGELYRSLLRNYSEEIRPTIVHTKPINVTFFFSLTQIIDMDERHQILTTSAWTRFAWQDHRLVWDPRLYNNVTRVHLPASKIWKPDIVLYNNADEQYSKSIMSTDAVVDYLGNVSWATACLFTSSCPLDIKHYPFDRQTCTMKYASWAYDGSKIDILLGSDTGDLTNYVMNNEWSIVNISTKKDQVLFSCCPDTPYPYVDVYITIDRRPMFYIFNLILPCVLISLIALLGFYMPTESGEKVTLGVTSLLSTTVFLMLVAEGMPPTSEALPLIGIYYGITIFVVAIATGMTVFTLNIHHSGDHGGRIPPFLQVLAFRFLAKILFLDLVPYHSIHKHVEFMYEKEHPNEKENWDMYLKRLENNEVMFDRGEHTLTEMQTPPPQQQSVISTLSLQVDSPRKSSKKKNHHSFTYRHYNNLHNDVSFSSPALSFRSSVPSTSPLSQRSVRVGNGHAGGGEVDPFEVEFLRVMKAINEIVERNELRVAELDKRDATRLEWEQVALVLDRFLLIVFFLGTIMFTFVILYQKELGIFE